jgi:hypothetical protein
MEYKWEKHHADPGPNSRDRMRVTLNDRGSFYLNPTAMKALGEPDAVEMLFDRKQSVVGILRSPIDRPGAYRLKRKSSNAPNGRMLYATGFCKKYRIQPKSVILFTDARVNKDGILILDLNQIAPVSRKPADAE